MNNTGRHKEIMQILGNAERLNIVLELSMDKMTAKQVAEQHYIDKKTAWTTLKRMEDAQIIKGEIKGKNKFYYTTPGFFRKFARQIVEDLEVKK